MKKTLTIPSK